MLTQYYELTQAPVGCAKVSNKIILYYVRPIKFELTADESIRLEYLIKPYVKKVHPLPPDPVEVLDLTPSGKPRLDENGKPQMILFRRNNTAGGDGIYSVITFKKDGSVTRLIYL